MVYRDATHPKSIDDPLYNINQVNFSLYSIPFPLNFLVNI